MKPAQPPAVPDGTPWERLDRAFRTVITVPKDALVKEERKRKRRRKRQQRK